MTKNWVSIHIFYASNSNPMLVEALEPLANDLKQRGLITRYFFIKYWQEGPHVRLRLLPAEGASDEEIKREAQDIINAYLKRRPALYSAENDNAQSFYKDMYITEYGEEKWNETYGAEGRMPLRANNSLHFVDYEPEYSRYGGVDGLEVAEWHFEKSSQIVMTLLRTTNLHVRSILLGLSIQLALPLCFGFLEDEQRIIQFLSGYGKYWLDNYHKDGPDITAGFEKKFSRLSSRLQKRVTEIHASLEQSATGTLTPVEREWIAHIRELRKRIDVLLAAKKMVFQGRNSQGEPFTPDDPIIAYNILLSSYIHMTNNRLGVLILDEIYLAYLMRRALEGRHKTDAPLNIQGVPEVVS